ncbi:hypothetical protein [Flavobacterium sp. WV_118_3]|nr:hypothetical protein [Flavobacterium sp.]
MSENARMIAIIANSKVYWFIGTGTTGSSSPGGSLGDNSSANNEM